MYHITLANGTIIKATSDHPFFIGGRWLKVHELQAGDITALYSGEALAIADIKIVAQPATVYNFEVEDFHTYYVSEQNVLVHNSGPCPLANRVKLQKGTKEQIKDAAPKTKDGRYIDPNTGKPIEKGQEVFGHRKGKEWHRYKKDPANQSKTRKEVIKDQNDPKKYQIEDRKSNASHKYEQKN